MCSECYNTATREAVSSVGEMAALVGGFDHIEFHDGFEEVIEDMRATPNTCLCPVDIAHTLLRAGYAVWRDEDFVYRGWSFGPAPLPPHSS